MPLLEREEQHLRFAEALREADRGAGYVVLVAGEAGSGKTSLLNEIVESIRPRWQVLVGHCDPMLVPRPLAALADLAESLGGRVAQEFAAGEGAVDLATALLSQIKRSGRPTLLAFEDVHWADSITLDLLRYLGRRIGQIRAALVLTYRDDEAAGDHPLRRMLGDIATAAPLRRIEVPPLSRDAVMALAAEAGHVAGDLYRRTGGNPFFVREVLANPGGGVPLSVGEAVAARIGRLSNSGREALEAGATLGTRFPWWAVDQGLDECVAAGLLAGDGREVWFRHELLREAVIESLPLTRRRHHHREHLARLLRSVEVDVPMAVEQAVGAGDAEAILQLAPQAGRRSAEAGAHREAAAHYELALNHAGRLGADERSSLLEALAVELYLAGEADPAHRSVNSALKLADRGSAPRYGELLRLLSKIQSARGEFAAARATILTAIGLLEPLGPSPELARAEAQLCRATYIGGVRAQAEGLVELAERALASAKAADDPTSLSEALIALGTSLGIAGRGGRDELLEAMRVADAAGLAEASVRARFNLANDAERHLALGETERWVREAERVAEASSLHSWSASCRSVLAKCLLLKGSLEEAAELAHSVVVGPDAQPRGRSSAALVRAWAVVRLGRTDVSAAIAAAGEQGRSDPWAPADLELLSAESAFFAGDLEAARTHIACGQSMQGAEPYVSERLGYWARRSAGLPPSPHDPTADGWRQRGYRFDAAVSLSESDRDADLRSALADFQLMDARPAAAYVSRRLQALGWARVPRGRRPSTRAHPAGLTEREAEVLELLAAGRRNSEIAAELFLSPRTVERHLTAIFQKLGVRTRTEAALAAGRL